MSLIIAMVVVMAMMIVIKVAMSLMIAMVVAMAMMIATKGRNDFDDSHGGCDGYHDCY